MLLKSLLFKDYYLNTILGEQGSQVEQIDQGLCFQLSDTQACNHVGNTPHHVMTVVKSNMITGNDTLFTGRAEISTLILS